jgi:hypothetical protein
VAIHALFLRILVRYCLGPEEGRYTLSRETFHVCWVLQVVRRLIPGGVVSVLHGEVESGELWCGWTGSVCLRDDSWYME